MSYDIGNTAKYKSLARDIIEYAGYGYDSKTEDEIAAWQTQKTHGILEQQKQP